MSLLHRLSLLQKFLILGTVGLLMSLLPTWLYVNDALDNIAKARQEAQGAQAGRMRAPRHDPD